MGREGPAASGLPTWAVEEIFQAGLTGWVIPTILSEVLAGAVRWPLRSC